MVIFTFFSKRLFQKGKGLPGARVVSITKKEYGFDIVL